MNLGSNDFGVSDDARSAAVGSRPAGELNWTSAPARLRDSRPSSVRKIGIRRELSAIFSQEPAYRRTA